MDATYDRREHTEPPEWIEHVTTHGMERIRATLRLEGQDVHISTNSETRMDRVLDTLRSLDARMVVVDETRRPMRDAREAAELATQLPVGNGETSPDPSDPRLAAALEQFTREYEQKWINEPIPALHGFTPRQAADDPTRRDDLIRLIDSFPDDENPGTMSPQRLKAKLGL